MVTLGYTVLIITLSFRLRFCKITKLINKAMSWSWPQHNHKAKSNVVTKLFGRRKCGNVIKSYDVL
jgi:hypothetical protein